MKNSKKIDNYIKAAPKGTRAHVRQMRAAIRKAAPQATETISYGLPTYKLNGSLVHFGAFKNHVSFFPTSSGVAAFKKELTKYIVSKGTIQFPLDRALPLRLVTRIVKFRVKQQLEPGRLKKTGKRK